MNHEIIAAGHPTLYFDMAVYHEAYPKHWREHKSSETNFRSQLWLAGKIAMADSELELIASRANKSLSVSTWPELSNYQCNRCHVSLQGIPLPNRNSNEDTLKGRAPVRNWNLAGLELLPQSKNGCSTELAEANSEIRREMQAATPDAILVGELAQKLRIRLFELVAFDGKPTLPDWSKQKQIRISLQLLEKSRIDNSWESASEAYVSLWATKTAHSSEPLGHAMKTIRNGLLFPKDMLSTTLPSERWDEALRLAVIALQSEACK